MRSGIFGFACLAILASAPSALGEIKDWEFEFLIGDFHSCGGSFQYMEEWPRFGLVEEYRILKDEMMTIAASRGASSEQLQELSEAFEAGRREVQEIEWREGASVDNISEEQFDDIVRGMRENLNMCLKF